MNKLFYTKEEKKTILEYQIMRDYFFKRYYNEGEEYASKVMGSLTEDQIHQILGLKLIHPDMTTTKIMEIVKRGQDYLISSIKIGPIKVR